MSKGSCIPVYVKPWNRHSIGIHPYHCKSLNLDFDGDELQVYMVTRLNSSSEIKCRLRERSQNGVTKVSIRQSHVSAFELEADEYNDICEDILVHSTVSTFNYPAIENDYHRMCLTKSLCIVPLDSCNYVARSMESMRGVIDSHLSVPVSYTVSRKLKCSALDLSCDNRTVYVPSCVIRVPTLTLELNSREACSAWSVVSDLMVKLSQLDLDRAKHRTATVVQSLLCSLVISGDEYVLRSDLDTLLENARSYSGDPVNILFTTSHYQICRVKSFVDRYSLVVRCVSIASTADGVVMSNNEIKSTSYLIAVCCHDKNLPLRTTYNGWLHPENITADPIALGVSSGYASMVKFIRNGRIRTSTQSFWTAISIGHFAHS
jgi:hypothetical protein